MVVSRRATQGPPYRGFPVEHCRAGSACLTAFNQGTSSNLRRGRCPHRPADRRKRSYILHRQRQRRRSRDDTKFRTRPTETLLADRKGSQETIRFLAHLWVLSVRTESTPPEADKPIHSPLLRQNKKGEANRLRLLKCTIFDQITRSARRGRTSYNCGGNTGTPRRP